MEILELIFVLIEGCGCLLEGMTLTGATVEGASFIASRKNRQRRKVAKKQGEAPPSRDVWSWLFLGLIPVLIGLGILMIVKYTMRRGG